MTTRQIDQAAFGVVYGSITVLAVHPPIEHPGRQAIMLFLAVFAVALAKAFAEICERVLQSGQSANWSDIGEVWQHAQTVLIAANGPTLAFVLAAAGVISGDMALLLAQILVFGLLAYFGARIGWSVSGTMFGMAVGVAVTGGIAGLVSLLKFVAH
ncbi:hypothetical protein SLH49_09095 [Cognatiyoonia sp. IB215446]|uniref:hypothetical protein n=1 Tax=Cognatiyoonia sp. IB215446 TaxID=3097355 RepID=UPI002A0E70EA|nr:hypothetical protein [Cognatiyoonia sp. IB215446]MDX8348141.1 hypothetical protein [Cognatiyoonia sp. IB215446]